MILPAGIHCSVRIAGCAGVLCCPSALRRKAWLRRRICLRAWNFELGVTARPE